MIYIKDYNSQVKSIEVSFNKSIESNLQTFKTEEIPWPLASVLPNTKLEKLDQDHYRLEYKNANSKPYQMSFEGYSFHAMGKKHLGDIVETDRRARLLDSSTEQ